MAEKRYESDLTKKEKRELEKEKIKSMTGKEKISYIWTYYKIHMAAVVGIILVLYVIGEIIYGQRFETVFSAAIVNAYTLDGEEMAADFKEYLGDTDKYHETSVDTSMSVTGSENNDYTSVVKLQTLTAAMDLDVLITTEDQFEEYADNGAFLPMDEVLTEEQLEAYGDLVSEYGLCVTDSETLLEYGYPEGQEAYLAVFNYTEHTEAADAFISYLMGE